MKKFFVGMTAMVLATTALGATSFAEIKVDKVQTVGALEEQKGATIEIKEGSKDAWEKTTSFELKLPSNVKWNEKTLINGQYKPEINGNTLKFNATTNPNYEDMVYVIPYFDVDKNAEKGNLTVLVSAGGKDEVVTIANIADYSVNISSSYKRVPVNSKAIPVEITLSEAVENSLLSGRPYAIVFDNATVVKESVKISQAKGADRLTVYDVKDNYAEFKVEELSSEKSKWVITMDIMPKKEFTGDITATFEGDSLDKVSSIVAKVSPAGNFEKRDADVLELGKKNQKLKNLVLSEDTGGSLVEGDYILKVSPEYKGLSFSSGNVNVVDGDMRAGSLKKDGSMIEFNVRGESLKASKLAFSDLSVTLDQFAYDGEYKIELVNKNNPDTVIASTTLFTVNPKADPIPLPLPEEPEKIKPIAPEKDGIYFMIGKKEYDIVKDGVSTSKTLDVAPYISKGNRTMLPIRATAETLNMNVAWNAKTYTATLTSKDKSKPKTIVLTIGDKMLLVDGKKVKLDSAPEIKGGRTFLPVAQIANALNMKTSWNENTQTAGLLK